MNSLYEWNDTTKIGVAMTAFGAFFTFLGVIFFLDSAFLTLGNLLFVGGVFLVMGPARCKSFFVERKRLRASVCFFLGILLVMMGYCFLGLCLQGFGFLNLFGNFFPMVIRVLEVTPLIGTVLRSEVAQTVMRKLSLIGGVSRTV